jgi:hypothetical protein
MSTVIDYKWVTEGPDFAFTDDERWEVSASGDGFSLRENLACNDPEAGDPDWEPVPAPFASMADAKAHADARQTAVYGIPDEKGRRIYEAWLKRQPTRDLREMLADDEIDADSAAFIRQAIEDRRSPSYDD